MLLGTLIVMLSLPAAPSPVISETLSYTWGVVESHAAAVHGDAVGTVGARRDRQRLVAVDGGATAGAGVQPLRGVGPDVEAEDSIRLGSRQLRDVCRLGGLLADRDEGHRGDIEGPGVGDDPQVDLDPRGEERLQGTRGVEDGPLLHVGDQVLQVDLAGAAGIVHAEVDRGEQAAADPGLEDPQVEGRVGRDAAIELRLRHEGAGPVGVLPVADVEAIEDQARVAEVVLRIGAEPRGVETEAELGLGADLAGQVRPERADDREEFVKGEAQVQLRRLVGDQRHILAQQELEVLAGSLRIGIWNPGIGFPVYGACEVGGGRVEIAEGRRILGRAQVEGEAAQFPTGRQCQILGDVKDGVDEFVRAAADQTQGAGQVHQVDGVTG